MASYIRVHSAPHLRPPNPGNDKQKPVTPTHMPPNSTLEVSKRVNKRGKKGGGKNRNGELQTGPNIQKARVKGKKKKANQGS